ncbi:MAG: sulfite oxidase heme-binding subunit YedZ [Pseudomonadota bacterium]
MRRWIKPGLHVALALPLLWLAWQWGLAAQGLPHGLGVNPIEATIRSLGDWGIRVLLGALAVTPLAQLSGWKPLMALRRMVGLWAFAYVALHFAAYFGMDKLLSLQGLWADVVKRQYITLGMAGLALLIPLAVTSTGAMVRRLGARRWKRLHKLVYAIGVLAVLHHWFMVKGVQLAPIVHGLILAALLGARVLMRLRRRLAPA